MDEDGGDGARVASAASVLHERLTAAVPRQRAPALAGCLTDLVRLALDEQLPNGELADGVHGQLNVRRAQDERFRSASAGRLLGECRLLRGVWTDLVRAGGHGLPRFDLDRVHVVVDACMGSIADFFVHEEELLRQGEAAFSLIIDTIPQLVWRTTPSGEATFANRPFLDHVGKSLEEVLGWGWLSHIHPEDQPVVAAEWARCRAAEREVQVTFRVRDRVGGYRWFLSLGRPFRDEHGALIAYYGTWTDIDDHKQAEAALTRAVHARDEFLSMASHELKTPLTALQLQVQMRARRLARGRHAQPGVEDLAAMLTDDAHHLGRIKRLIDDMLDVSRLEGGTLSLRPEKLEMVSFLRGVVERHEPLMQQAACPTTYRGEGLIEGRWDPIRIEQVLANLLNNCCRYAAGSRVEVRVRRAGDAVVLEVDDRGPGIDPADQQRIFGRFERGPCPREHSGLGLGLYLVKHIVELYHGKIGVDSPASGGCIFRAELPLVAETT